MPSRDKPITLIDFFARKLQTHPAASKGHSDHIIQLFEESTDDEKAAMSKMTLWLTGWDLPTMIERAKEAEIERLDRVERRAVAEQEAAKQSAMRKEWLAQREAKIKAMEAKAEVMEAKAEERRQQMLDVKAEIEEQRALEADAERMKNQQSDT